MALTPDYLNDEEEVVMETRVLSPSHFLFKVEFFSKLWNNGIDKYETPDFLAGGYKWRLVIYANGRDKENKDDHVSVYLVMAETSSLPERWEVNVVFSIFLHNQKLDNFLSMRGRTRRFHAFNTEWGYSKFMPKITLKDPSNGYLVDDNCVIGAEVFVINSPGAIECLPILKAKHEPYKHSIFNISNFSKLPNVWNSEKIVMGNRTWYVVVYPKGNSQGNVGNDISIYLKSDDSKPEVKAKFTLGIKNKYTGERLSKSAISWFPIPPPTTAWGWNSFMPLKDLNDPYKGYVVGDCCVIEVEIKLLAIAHDL